MDEGHTREVWTGTLSHVTVTTLDGEEALTGLMRQGTPTEPVFRVLPVVATRAGLAACRRLFRNGQAVCLLGEITPTDFRAIAPAIQPDMVETANRRAGTTLRTERPRSGDVVNLFTRRPQTDAALDGLVGLA